MNHFLVLLGLAAGFMAYGASEASAVVCARGVVRAGCVGPGGVVGVRRVVAPRAVVIRRAPVRGAVYRGRRF